MGLFSYGSGCASEFYSGVVSEHARSATTGGRSRSVADALAERQVISVAEYDGLPNPDLRAFGVRTATFDPGDYEPFFGKLFAGQALLVLSRIDNYHREYRWT